MEEDLKQKERHNVGTLDEGSYEQVGLFSRKMQDKYKGLISSVLLKKHLEEGLHILLMVDDLNNVVLDQQVAELKMAASELAFSLKVDLRCDALLASEFWDLFRSRDESMLQLLRESFVVADNGFMIPIQDLLVTGKIRPSKESVQIYFVKAERSLKTSNNRVAKAVLDLYWAVIDAAHAAVMVAGITPPSPKEMAETVRKELVLRNLVHKRCAEIVDRFYHAAKSVMHKERFGISGKEFDAYLADADFFIKEIDCFVREHTKEK